jgi:hypothetical protein
MLFFPVFAKLQSRPSCSLHPESFDPAKSSLFPSSMDHGSEITTLPAVAGIAPCLHSTSFFSVVSGLIPHNGGPQLICFSIACGLFPLQWGCIYPHSPQKPVEPQQERFYLLFLYALTHPFSNNEGGTHTPSLQKSSTKMKHEILHPRQSSPLP